GSAPSDAKPAERAAVASVTRPRSARTARSTAYPANKNTESVRARNATPPSRPAMKAARGRENRDSPADRRKYAYARYDRSTTGASIVESKVVKERRLKKTSVAAASVPAVERLIRQATGRKRKAEAAVTTNATKNVARSVESGSRKKNAIGKRMIIQR